MQQAAHDPRRALSIAARARAILEDPLVTDALSAIEAELHANWASSRAEDAAGREDAYRMLRAAHGFRARLEKLIGDGALARAEIEAQEAQARRKQENS